MNNLIEDYLKSAIFPELESGRPNWDKPHTEAVVFYLKEILNCENLNLDEDVLIIAAYAHDWGYSGLFKNGEEINYDQILDMKEEHARIGAIKISKLLKNQIFDFLSQEQKERIIHLVFVHDRLNELKDIDEITLMEADTLGGLDINFIIPTIDRESNKRYLEMVKNKRLGLFIHGFSKVRCQQLITGRENFYIRHDSAN
jgi:hypothetical protein